MPSKDSISVYNHIGGLTYELGVFYWFENFQHMLEEWENSIVRDHWDLQSGNKVSFGE